MQLGITIPLQKYLNLPKQSYGEPEDVFLLGNPPDPLSADEPGYLKIFTKLVTYFTGFVRVLLCIVYKNKVSCRNSTILELKLARCLLIIKVNKPKGENHNERGI